MKKDTREMGSRLLYENQKPACIFRERSQSETGGDFRLERIFSVEKIVIEIYFSLISPSVRALSPISSISISPLISQSQTTINRN